jgi:metal-responsive CopG/Arc/MetJ family transcriptional regulator
MYHFNTQWGGLKMSQVLNMRYPKELLKRIDEFKEKKGFTTRTQTIIYLIQYALEQLDN